MTTVLHTQPLPVQDVTPYRFLETVIACLAQAHDTITEINAQKNDDFFGKMVALKNGKIEFDTASRRLQPFVDSDIENVKLSSATMVDAFRYIRESFQIQLTAYEKINVATSAEQVLSVRGPISDAAVMYQQSSALLVDAALVAVASAMIADPKDPDNHVALMMSASERIALIKTLKLRFGGKLAATNGNTGPMSAAKAMLNVLAKNWRLAK
jgi:hypothetical protein